MALADKKYAQLEQNGGLLSKEEDQTPANSVPTFPLLMSLVLASATCIILFAYSFSTLSHIHANNTHAPANVTFNASTTNIGPQRNGTALVDFYPTELEHNQLWLMVGSSALGLGTFLLLGLLVLLGLATRLFRRMPAFFVAITYILTGLAVLAQVAAFTYGVIQNKGSDVVTDKGFRDIANGNATVTYVGQFDAVEWFCGLSNYTNNNVTTIELQSLCDSATAALGFTAYTMIFSTPVLFAAISYIRQVRERY